MVCETRNLLTLQYTVYAEPDKGWTVLRLIGVCVCVGGGGGGVHWTHFRKILNMVKNWKISISIF